MSNKKVVIVAPVYNRRDLTLQCLRSLAKIDKTGLDIHIIIVDDGSIDGTADAIREQFPEVELVFGDGNLWYTAGTNRGLEAALKHNPDYVLAINDDEVFDDKFLQYMIDTAEKHPRSVVGGLLLLWDTPHKLFQVSPRWETWRGGWRHWFNQTVWTIPKEPWKVELLVGNCVLYPVEAIREVGLMDEYFFPNFGDAEYTPRMRKKGWRLLIEPRARVFCQPNTIPTSISKMSFGKKLNYLLVDIRQPQNLRRRFYNCWFGAPSKLQGLLAFMAFFVRYTIGKNAEGTWAMNQEERPLAETFANAVVKD
jgi:GT2 family glycosyltransferase